MSDTVYNFNAGPATLPRSVILQAQAELADYHGCGYSILEESHRAPAFEEVIQAAEANLRKLMGISDDYAVLFLQGGASLQFAQIPMNLCVPGKKVGAADTGEWAHKAIKELQIQGKDVDVVYDGSKDGYKAIGDASQWKIDPDYAYFHICANNTIYGTEYQSFPQTGEVPLVADMSSDIMSRVVDVSKFGLIYAGAQKNMGPSGATVVIIRKDLAERCPATVPTMLRYTTHISKGSLFNTPPTFGIYIIRLVTDWMLANGGVPAIQKVNEEKAALLYEAIDNSNYYRGTCAKADRSKMNVPFRIADGNADLEKKFVAEAKAEGLVGLKGHRAVGGLRASIYNAMPKAGIIKLIDFMKAFADANPL